jgi:hypothetical protein
MQRIERIAAIILTGCVIVYTVLWRGAEQTPESLAAMRGAATAFVVALGLLVVYEVFFNKQRIRKRKQARQKRTSLFISVHDTLSGEMRNLEHIAEKRPYNNEQHRRAVEQVSFGLIAEQMPELAAYWSFRTIARRVEAECRRNIGFLVGKKDVSILLPLVAKLERQLDKGIKRVQ